VELLALRWLALAGVLARPGVALGLALLVVVGWAGAAA
jgi:hypothetical protein